MKKFYVVGNKTSNSLSPTIFNYWFKKYKIKAKYGYLEIDSKDFDKKIKDILEDKDVYGLNITIPFKQKIIRHLGYLDKHAKTINAVNCVSTKLKIKGKNTDWSGYYKTLPKLKNIRNKNIILIGYGGAALAIHYVLLTKGFKKIYIFNRTKKTLRFGKKKKYTLSMKNLKNYLFNSDIIINTTPINPIKSKQLRLVNKETILSDIVYKPKNTSFLKAFPDNKKIYGISMLLEQAIPCFRTWFGFSPPIDSNLIKILEKKIR